MKRFAALAAVLMLAACTESTVEPTALNPSLYAGAPLGKGNCTPKALKAAQTGRINPGSCLFIEETGRRSAYYKVATPAANEMLTVTLNAEFGGVFGVKQATDDPAQGIVWGSLGFVANTPRSIAFIGSSAEQQVYVSGADSTQSGTFDLTSAVAPVSYTCGVPVAVEAPVNFTITHDAAHSCRNIIRFSPFPDAIGKPINTHFFNAKLIPGRSYEIRIAGLTDSFNPALTIFKNGGVLAQSVGLPPADGVRRLVVTSHDLGYFGIEISSGVPDGNGGWINPEGTYTLSVSAL